MASPVVHVVDDEEPTRTATARLLRAEGFDACVHASADAFLQAVQPGVPGCILLDLQMPDISGLELQTKLHDQPDPLPIIFLTGHAEIPDAVRALQQGAVEFLTKPVEGAVLIEAVRRALAKDAVDREARRRQRLLRERYERLTPREREVLRELLRGQLNKQAAAELSIAERTIKLHRARIFEKMEADSMTGLTRMAVELGIAPADLPRKL